MADEESRACLNVNEDTIASDQHLPRQQRLRVVIASSVVLAVVAVLALAAGGKTVSRHGTVVAPSRIVGLDTEELPSIVDPCSHLPTIRLDKVKHSNLGNSGPAEGEEGIIYGTSTLHEGLDKKDVELHLHALDAVTNERAGEKYHPHYTAPWPKANGINGHFGVINVASGQSVKLQVHAAVKDDDGKYNDVRLGKAAITFFDLDAGLNGNQSVEFIRVRNNFASYWLTNTTEVQVDEGEEYTKFAASKRGTGTDNPANPIKLTPLQKNRAVTVSYDDIDHIEIEVGASEGKTVRVFQFTVRPALACAQTEMPNGDLLAWDDEAAGVRSVHHQRGQKKSSAWALQPLYTASALALLMCMAN